MPHVSQHTTDMTVDEIERDLRRAMDAYLKAVKEENLDSFALLNAIVTIRTLSEELIRWLVL